MTIGERIRQIRKKEKLTQKQFGEWIDCSEICVKKWEHNEREPASKALKNICITFNVDANYLLGIEGDK